MIEDQELRDLFKAESDEHLQKLDEGLLHLEKNPDDMETLKTLFREAHSLKGAARMLGVADVEALSHRFEDILGAASKGQLRFSSPLVDGMVRGLDDIRAMVQEAVFGEPSRVSLSEAMARMAEVSVTDARPIHVAPPVVAPRPPAKPVMSSPPPMPPPVVAPVVAQPAVVPREEVVAPKAPPIPPPVAPPPPVVEEAPPRVETKESKEAVEGRETTLEEEVSRIDTIRVDPRKLDILLNQVGELSVVRTRVKRRLKEIDEALGDWEDLQRSALCSGPDLFLRPPGQGVGEHDGVRKRFDQLGGHLRELRHGLFEDEASLDLLTRELEEGIRSLRLLPLSTLFNLFPRMVRDLSRQQDKPVELLLKGGDTTADKRILEEMKGPLTHLLRNAMHHGMEEAPLRQKLDKPLPGTIQIKASRTATHIVIEISDDGRGLDMEAIRQTALKLKYYSEAEIHLLSPGQLHNLIFTSGFSTTTKVTDVSGRGVGLDAVRSGVERLKGSIQVDSTHGKGTSFVIRIPITLATTPVFIVEAAGQVFAIPLDFVHSVRQASPSLLFTLEGRQTLSVNGVPVSVVGLADLLALPPPARETALAGDQVRPCIILDSAEDRIGVFVDQLLDEMEVVMKPHTGIIKRVRNISGASIMGNGEVCMVINPLDLIQTAKQSPVIDRHLPDPAGDGEGKKGGVVHEGMILSQESVLPVVLLAEDSITTRTQEKRILEGAGYQVIMAVDGLDALDKLQRNTIHAVVTDIQMPKMDGLTLTRKIRQNKQYQALPIILVTSLSSEDDMRQGLDAGASAYLVKTAFDQKVLLDTLRRLV